MSLTLGPGPLSTQPEGGVNFAIEGPAHRLLFQPHPRHLRAEVGGQTVLDTTRGALLHESNILPVLYVPLEDFDTTLLEPTGHTTHCPFKGDAFYWTLRVGDREEENAVWGYPEPLPEAAWLAPYAALPWGKADRWLEEDETVAGHVRDPYHRVDTRSTSRHVEVLAGGEPLASSDRAVLVFETGLPARAYLPLADVEEGLLAPGDTTTTCPYKGEASYFSVAAGGRVLADAAWTYERPLGEALALAGHVCFDHEELETRIAEPARAFPAPV
jgi:uncharacterized protein (DUF427 family)